MMSAYIIKNRLTRDTDLKDFDGGGYRYNASLSTPQEPVFSCREG